jgi:hypothetical protein
MLSQRKKEIIKALKRDVESLKNSKMETEAKILQWYYKTKDVKFAEFMGITNERQVNSKD